MALRVLAVAPPGLPYGELGERTLKSADPASLYNACRIAGKRASDGVGAWGRSNWNVSRKELRNFIFLMNSMSGDVARFRNALTEVRPNFLLMGAMTMCMPGAVECARIAREMLGDDVCIVLGGRHPSETIRSVPQLGQCYHHVSSPVMLMSEGKLDPLFDITVSGEGEYLIPWLGEEIDRLDAAGTKYSFLTERMDEAVTSGVEGEWAVSALVNGSTKDWIGTVPIANREELPSAVSIFGAGGAFDVFPDTVTGHLFSESGNGCVFNCDFCSEARSITGGIKSPVGAARRLFGQIQDMVLIAEEDHKLKPSGFVEDSTLLGGNKRQLRELAALLSEAEFSFDFGCQFTVDQILKAKDEIRELSTVGLSYIFIGIETFDPSVIGGMSKDLSRSDFGWLERSEQVISFLASVDVRVGVAILFGLGERQDHRIALLEQLKVWRERYGSPKPVSLNWAAQHPLASDECRYLFHEWGVPTEAWCDAFRNFGEATVRYPVQGVEPPDMNEVKELNEVIDMLL